VVHELVQVNEPKKLKEDDDVLQVDLVAEQVASDV
jgi:hypothetical protein